MKTMLKKITKNKPLTAGVHYNLTIKYFIDTSSESFGSEETKKINLDKALVKINKLQSGDHIGFINEEDKCIQLLKDSTKEWTIDCPILNKKQEYLYSIGQRKLTIEIVFKIVSLFFINEKWEHLCTDLKRIN